MNFEHYLSEKAKIVSESSPELFDLRKSRDRNFLSRLVRSNKVQLVVDDYREQQLELFGVKNPARAYTPNFKEEFIAYFEKLQEKRPLWQHGRWTYFPWSSTLVHILGEHDFQFVRTARNKNLISESEQEKFYNAAIGIAGLSVGNSVALAIALQGGGRHMRLADFDHLALSNTNRIRAGIENLGLLKVEMTARQIYETNPYAKVELFSDGLTKKNIGKFFKGLDIVVDEIDSLAVKILIREQAKRHRLPVVMAADNGDNAVVDIERYDLNPKQKFFHNRMGLVTYEGLLKLNKFGIGKLITRHVGAENVTERMQESLLEMGKTIVSWPQLGGAALLNGSAVAYCVRKILNGQPIEKNRALISLDEKLVPGYNSPAERKHRAKSVKEFRKIFGL